MKQKRECITLIHANGISENLTGVPKMVISVRFSNKSPQFKVHDLIKKLLLANERVFIDFKDNGRKPSFVPDGMTIDTDGNLYVACYLGSKVLKISGRYGN